MTAENVLLKTNVMPDSFKFSVSHEELDEAASPRSDSHLPTELWLSIFRLVTGEPASTFDTSLLPPMSVEPRAWSKLTPALPFTSESPVIGVERNNRTRTSLSLVLVSKHWRDIATSILYEFVLLEHRTASVSFAQTLAKHGKAPKAASPSGQVGGLNPGRLVKRLQLHFNPDDWDENSVKTFQTFASSFRYCDRLSILVTSADLADRKIHFAERIEQQVIEVLLRSNHGIRYIRRRQNALPLILAVQQFSSINVLSLSSAPLSPKQLPAHTLSFPSLPTLLLISSVPDTDHCLEVFARWHLPVLQRFYSSNFSKTKSKHFNSFFKSFGATLKSIDLHSTRDPCLSTILPHCAAIQEIALSYYAVKDLTPVLHKIMGITLLGTPLMMSAEVDRLRDSIEFLFRAYTPQLAVLRIPPSFIRFIENEPAGRSHQDEWKRWVEKWTERNVRFELFSRELIEITEGNREPGTLWWEQQLYSL